LVWQVYTSWHQLPNRANLSVMVAFPFSNVSLISIRRCPSCASVLMARAYNCVLSLGGGVYWLACIFMVRLFIVERSGSCAARARRSTGAMFGMVGGAMCTLAIASSSVQSISSPHCIASYCYVSNSNLLLILVGISLQVMQKSIHTNDFFFFYTNYLHTINFTPCFSKCAYSNT
jgi:hypothetical protein